MSAARAPHGRSHDRQAPYVTGGRGWPSSRFRCPRVTMETGAAAGGSGWARGLGRARRLLGSGLCPAPRSPPVTEGSCSCQASAGGVTSPPEPASATRRSRRFGSRTWTPAHLLCPFRPPGGSNGGRDASGRLRPALTAAPGT
ncbi:uncharacterized protein LOC132212614 isoform X2 [Myotis daubentonii]|uniref:uncharacterized protein LOC132212614 isoform X2 n=1 Tax=Myotis daubentonii TaxID=98922 RepID=UPI002872D781|nr:uncharacterized protein LOC132212614 isoform X2 [Myotis daubentonii]